MRRLKKILKWTGMILFLIISGITITVLTRQHSTYVPLSDIRFSKDTAIIAAERIWHPVLPVKYINFIMI